MKKFFKKLIVSLMLIGALSITGIDLGIINTNPLIADAAPAHDIIICGGRTALRVGPSTATAVIRTLEVNTRGRTVGGAPINGFWEVNIGARGWVNGSHLCCPV